MTSGTKNWIIAGMALIILTGIFFLGYSRYPVWNKPSQSTHDSIFIHDTVPKIIPDSFPYYIEKKVAVKYRDSVWMDSVIKANRVDTTGIFNIYREYYSLNYYDRNWQDTLVQITIHDMITENMPADNNFTYKLLKPLTVIDNSTTTNLYTKYIYLGGSITLPDSKYSNLGVYGAFPRSFFGISYIPYNPGVMLTAGFKIIKFK
jgi:hypothetical protein